MAEASTQTEGQAPEARATSSTAHEIPGSPTLPNDHPPGEHARPNPSPTPGLVREESRVVQLLEQINNNQEQILRLLNARANPGHGISQTAQTLWHSPHHALEYMGDEAGVIAENSPGLAFLSTFAPCSPPSTEHARDLYRLLLKNSVGRAGSSPEAAAETSNFLRALDAFKTLAARFISSDPALTLSNIDQWWPRKLNDSDNISYGSYGFRAFFCAFGDVFQDAFKRERVFSATLEVCCPNASWSKQT